MSAWTSQPPRLDGVYWWRPGPGRAPYPVVVAAPVLYRPGDTVRYDVRLFGGQWAGPVNPPPDEEEVTQALPADEGVVFP